VRIPLPRSCDLAIAMPVRLQPAAGLPTPLSIAEDQAFSTLVSTQLDSVRKTAENWRNGLVAMAGLIAAFSIIKGPSDVADLTHGVAYGVGILLILALCGRRSRRPMANRLRSPESRFVWRAGSTAIGTKWRCWR
jgi:hypothetical protein